MSEPLSSENQSLDDLLGQTDPKRKFTDEGELAINQENPNNKAHELVKKAGNKLPTYIAEYYVSDIYLNRLQTEVANLSGEIDTITDDNFQNFRIILEQKTIETNFREDKKRLQNFVKGSHLFNPHNAGDINFLTKSLQESCNKYNQDVFKFFTDTTISKPQSAYRSLVEVSAERQSQTIVANYLDEHPGLHRSEVDTLTNALRDTLMRYYKSNEGISYVLIQLGSDKDKKKHVDPIPHPDLTKIINQTKKEYLDRDIKREGYRRTPVITINEREELIDELLNELTEDENQPAIWIIPKVGDESLQRELMQVARSFVQTEAVEKALQTSGFSSLYQESHEPKSPNKFVEKLVCNAELLDYVEGRVLVADLENSVRSVTTTRIFQSTSISRDYFGDNIGRDKPAIEIAVTNINNNIAAIQPITRTDTEEKVRLNLLALRDYFGKKAYGDSWERERARLDKAAGINGKKEVQLPENITAGELKQRLSEAQTRLSEISLAMKKLGSQPANAIQYLSVQYAENLDEIQSLLGQLQNRL